MDSSGLGLGGYAVANAWSTQQRLEHRPAPDFICLGSYCNTETDPLGLYELSHSSFALVLE